MPSNSGADLPAWRSLFASVPTGAAILLCGDFNAHSGHWGSSLTNAAGRLISALVSDFDLIPLNDSSPTFIAGPGMMCNNLDVVFLSASLFHLSSFYVGDDSFGSGHLPVFCSLELGDDPRSIYGDFLTGVSSALEACGAYRPSSLRGKRKAQPLWWNPQCDAAIARRRSAIKAYLCDQTKLGKVEFRRIDEEVKRFLKSQKSESFRSYCESLSTSSGSGNICRTVRSMSARRVSGCSGVTNSPDSPEFCAMQDELVQPLRSSVDLPRIESVDETDLMNAPFSHREFSAALASCGVRTSPGLYVIEYRVVKGLSSFSQEFLLALFNRMFLVSLFPGSWRDSLVVFIPKAGSGKFRPISLTSTLCKLFERLVQRRVEHLAEFGDWVPLNQYGLRRGRSSLDCVAAVVCDILSGLGSGESSYALALDLKRACNAVLPAELFRQLCDLRLPGRLLNFISFLTAKRHLFFSPSDPSSRACDVGVPQGGVLSPILLNLHLRLLNRFLPAGVRAAMYADDLLLYVRGTKPAWALDLLELAMGSLTAWLGNLGLSISIPKCQLCVFSRARRRVGDVSIRAGDSIISCQPTLKYLDVILESRLTCVPHIRYIADKATRATKILRVITRVSWGANPALLLTVYRNLVRSYLEWGAPFFHCASRSALCILDRAQLGALRVTPTSVLLSEAEEPPLSLRRSLLSSRFILRNFSWRGSPLIPRIQLLRDRVAAGRLRLRSSRCGLFSSYLSVLGLVEGRHRTRRPSFFDVPWRELSFEAAPGI